MTSCSTRGDGARGEIVGMLGCAYVDSEEEEMEGAVGSFGAPDLFVAATGHTPLAWRGTKLLNENGVGALLGIAAEEHFPGLLERFVTERVSLDEVERPFESPGEGEIKTVVVLREL